jgi:hypothetical protein
MKTATVTCMERGKAKTYTGELISRDFGGVHMGLWDKQGSSYRSAFTHKRSVEDFEEWKETLFRLNADMGNVIMAINNDLTEFDFEDLGVTAKEIFENEN